MRELCHGGAGRERPIQRQRQGRRGSAGAGKQLVSGSRVGVPVPAATGRGVHGGVTVSVAAGRLRAAQEGWSRPSLRQRKLTSVYTPGLN
jgi:hypothetical protein